VTAVGPTRSANIGVAGPIDKRREDAARLTVASADTRAPQADLDPLDKVIRCSAPEVDGRPPGGRRRKP
jgi:hypothetical protein